MENALEIRNLKVSYNSIEAVRGVSLTLERGTITALIGESGAGKSTVASAIIGLLPRNATAEGEIIYKGQNLLGSDEKTLRCIRKKNIALIPQSHMAALEPMNKAVSILKWKTAHSNQKDKSYINAVLASAGIDNPERILSSYPEDLSGGTRQRILIASALASDTDIIIADEMTSDPEDGDNPYIYAVEIEFGSFGFYYDHGIWNVRQVQEHNTAEDKLRN